MGDKVSVVIPSRKERFLNKTIREIQEKFEGEYEVIVILDGADEKRLEGVEYIYNESPKGMRTAINQAVEIATGKYIMKLDAHCMLDQGIDSVLKDDHKPNWVQIPRRKRLDAHKWELIEDERPDVDYMQLNEELRGLKAGTKNRDPELKKKLLDDAEAFQGSCYLIEKDYFNKLGLLDDKNFAPNGHEAQEICFNVWYDGGRVVRNKKTWYAHARLGRRYAMDRGKSREYIFELADKYGINKV